MSCQICKIKNERIETLKMHIVVLEEWKRKHKADSLRVELWVDKSIAAARTDLPIAEVSI